MSLLASSLAEPYATALLVAVLGVLVALTVLLSKAVDHIGIPVVLVLLILGMLGGSEGLGGRFGLVPLPTHDEQDNRILLAI